jgi:hypothetical protein
LIVILDRNKKYYYSHLLDQREQHMCDLIVDAAFQLKESVSVPNEIRKGTTFNRIFDVISLDFPELYFFDISKASYVYSGFSSKVNLGYRYTRVEIEKLNQIIRTHAKEVSELLRTERTKTGAEKIIHDYLMKSIKYPQSNTGKSEYHTIVGALVERMAVCEGYSRAFKFLCESNNLLCMTVSGTAISKIPELNGPHAWNIVKLANYGCFHVDTTWDSCFYHSGSSSHVYYNQSDADMLADHIWDRSKVPECKSQFGERIPCCKSLSELENVICTNVKANKLSFSVRVDHEFSSSKEAMEVTSKIVHRHFELKIKSYTVGYISERKQVEYTFMKY